MISIKNIQKTYQSGDIKVQALQDVNLTINNGEFTAIVGPSGSGKTTLLNIIGGLDSPTKGSVKINYTEITQLSENELIDFRLHHIGFIFQSYNLIPVLTAKENVEFLMLLQKKDDQFRNERTLKLLKAVGLADQVNKKPNEMSGGQQQRVAVARALASKPSFILADEPTGNLDSKTSLEIMALFDAIHAQGNTVIVVTHEEEVAQHAHRVIRLRDGLVESDIRIK